MKIKGYTNSILSFLASVMSLIIILDYMLWPKVIKASDTLPLKGDQLKFFMCIFLLLIAIIFQLKSKSKEQVNRWQKGAFINIILVGIFMLGSILFAIIITLF